MQADWDCSSLWEWSCSPPADEGLTPSRWVPCADCRGSPSRFVVLLKLLCNVAAGPSDSGTGGGIASLPLPLHYFYRLPDDSRTHTPAFLNLSPQYLCELCTSSGEVSWAKPAKHPKVHQGIVSFHFLNLLNGRMMTLFFCNVKFPGCCSAATETDATSLCSQLDFSIFHYTLARSQCKYPAVALVYAPAVVSGHLCRLSLC